ncbi:MAG TPA: branched-chain amino acid ABC transporter permease [Kiritimatiellia bacterium]|nr:branched-chain amino acid ABC transporter permease [Kiritimatiellia bacterium]HSA17504.1 branched-chain amino acid ABC transporter permease [Kiritimatiellia bacterium]
MNQLVANTVIAAGAYILSGIGFAVIYRTTRFFHFAHASAISLSAYLGYACITRLQIHIIPSILVCVLAGTALGCTVDAAVYRPLRARQAGPLALLLASLGVYLTVHNALALWLGDDFKSVRISAVREGLLIGGARVTPTQLAIVVAACAAVVGVALFLAHTLAGRRMRAVASDPALAAASGIAVNQSILLAFAIGSALGAVAGLLLAIDSGVYPNMGLNSLLMGVVAVIVGGAKRIGGILVGALLVAGAQQLASWHLGAQWQDCAAFVILVAFLLMRRNGMVALR